MKKHNKHYFKCKERERERERELMLNSGGKEWGQNG